MRHSRGNRRRVRATGLRLKAVLFSFGGASMKKFLAAAFLVLAFFYLASGLNAQTVQGVITGSVTDPSGASVPGATVTLTNVGTNISQTTTTSAEGSYRFSLVPPGAYTVDVKATSFAEFKASGIVVQASQVIPFNVKLEIAKGTTT